MLYDQIEPFGSPRDDRRAGVIAAVMANVNRNHKTRSRPWMPADLFDMFPWQGADAVESGPMDLGGKIRAVLGSLGSRRGKVTRRPRD